MVFLINYNEGYVTILARQKWTIQNVVMDFIISTPTEHRINYNYLTSSVQHAIMIDQT